MTLIEGVVEQIPMAEKLLEIKGVGIRDSVRIPCRSG